MRIVLIGDSIRMGYMERVRRLIGERAEVVWPEANCGNSMMIREHLSEWVTYHAPDLVHFNAGIHDLGWMPDETVPRFAISAYVRNLRIILRRLRKTTHARLIFATTTPFLIPMDAGPREQCRIAPVVSRYNAAAVRLMESSGVPVNDLYQAAVAAGVSNCLGDDRLHMNDHGNEVLAAAVVASVMAVIGNA